MMRVTTNSTIYTYQKNLLKTSNQLYSAMNSMTTGRNFDAYSADPAAATRAFQIHSSLNATNAQASNNQTVHKKFSTAWDVADDVIDMVTDLGVSPTMKGLNDPSGLSTLNTQGDVIFSGAESIIQSLNSKYDNSFIFGGADTENPPFAIETVRGQALSHLPQCAHRRPGPQLLHPDLSRCQRQRGPGQGWQRPDQPADAGQLEGRAHVCGHRHRFRSWTKTARWWTPPPLTLPSPAWISWAAAVWTPTETPITRSPSWCVCPRFSRAMTRRRRPGAPAGDKEDAAASAQ